MNNINWKLRLKSKAFWLAVIPALALAVQAIAAVFGFEYDFGDLVNKLIVVVNTVFAVLVIIGIVKQLQVLPIVNRRLLMSNPKAIQLIMVMAKSLRQKQFIRKMTKKTKRSQ